MKSPTLVILFCKLLFLKVIIIIIIYFILHEMHSQVSRGSGTRNPRIREDFSITPCNWEKMIKLQFPPFLSL